MPNDILKHSNKLNETHGKVFMLLYILISQHKWNFLRSLFANILEYTLVVITGNNLKSLKLFLNELTFIKSSLHLTKLKCK